MSHAVDLRWALEAERRRREYLARIRENATRFLENYRAALQNLVREDLEQYLPEEFDQARRGMDAVASLLVADPEAARDESFRLGGLMAELPSLARAARAQFEARERERARREREEREKNRSEIQSFLTGLLLELKDAAVRDFALEGVRKLQAEWGDRAPDPGRLEAEKEALRSKFLAVRSEAEARAREWKARKREETRAEAQAALLEMHRREAERDAAQNPEAMADLESMKESVRKGAPLDPKAFEAGIAAAAAKADEAVVDERCRKETVKAVLESLRKAGFVVETPQRRREGGRDEVVVIARKPAGQQAAFRIDLRGGMEYRFDRYEGKTCKKDIGKVLPSLQEIYGVKLSDEKTIWENPDRLSSSARPMDPGKEENSLGR
jgi:NADH dehydrogenase/NADH:ubiquinone oxidoreductase subunit G